VYPEQMFYRNSPAHWIAALGANVRSCLRRRSP
jgi:hypothetical protein